MDQRHLENQKRDKALTRQIRRLEQRLVYLHQSSQRYALVRAVLFFGGLLLSGGLWYLAGLTWLVWLMILVSLVSFGGAVAMHRKIEQSLTRHEAWRKLKLTHLARMRLDWAHIPTSSRFPARPAHPFEADLDLVGDYSLHRLLDTTVSRESSLRLREWLTHPAPDLAQTLQRQQLVRELAPRALFRDKLILKATVAADSQKMWDARRLLRWLEHSTSAAMLRLWLIIFGLLVGFNLLAFGLERLGLIPAIWPASAILYFGLLYWRASRSGDLLGEAVTLQQAIEQVSAVAHHLESFSYCHTPHLKALCHPFLDPAHRPSQHLARVRRLVTGAGLRENPFVWFLLNAVSPWDALIAYRLNRQKQAVAAHLPGWLDTWFEVEALSALANLAYLNPTYTFPQLTEGASAIVFCTRQMGHPLLPEAERVRNDFAIDALGEVALITGSNMAGKSTFLRTIGINLALAYAGGPVSAETFESRMFRLFTTIKVSDSVTSGVSYFYAEVKRLKALLEALAADDPRPLFFFIDEIFRGTNNRERFIGSRAYLQAVVGKWGLGLISTHDLELTKLADQTSQIRNYHFRDEVVGEEMVFDYKLRPGPCPTTNALKIMALEGLPVEAAQMSS